MYLEEWTTTRVDTALSEVFQANVITFSPCSSIDAFTKLASDDVLCEMLYAEELVS